MKGLTVIVEPHADDASLGAYMPLITSDQIILITCTDSGVSRHSESKLFENFINSVRRSKRLPEIKVINLGFVDGNAGADIPSLAKALSDSIPKAVSTVFIPEESLHQDHKSVKHACLIALRSYNCTILSYEYPEACSQFYSSSPNVFTAMSDLNVSDKGQGILCYQSQVHDLRNDNSVRALATMRGLSIGKQYAEAYTLVRQVLTM